MTSSEQDRQIVVATDHLHAVAGELGGRYVETTAVNTRLGLTLVTLPDASAAGRMLAERRAAEFPQARPAKVGSDLDLVLSELRSLFELRYTSWRPTLGKNRTLTGVQFKPYSNGGFDKPTPAAAPTAGPHRPVDRQAARVRVGLFDTRLAPHGRLTGRFVADDDALLAPVPSGRRRQWWEGHATFIAGIVRRHAPTAVLDVRTALRPGTAPAVGATAEENWTLPVWDFASTLADYQDSGISVLNLSVGLSTEDGRPPLVLERAVAQLTPSTVVVAAAGNHGSDALTDEKRKAEGLPTGGAPLFPAALDNVLAVGALDGTRAAEFNPRGAGGKGVAPWIDVFAPGVDTVSPYLGDGGGENVLVRDLAGREELVDFAGWASWSGTSFAAGEITGAIAALLAEGHDPVDAVREVRKRYPRPEHRDA